MKLFIVLGVAWASVAAAQITLNEMVEVRFGDAIDDVERALQEKAFDVQNRRSGIDRMIATTSAELTFDQGRLWRVTLKDAHLWPKPPRPHAEPWRTLEPIGDKALKWPVMRAQFDAYLEAWKTRAAESGQREGADYWVKGASVASGERRERESQVAIHFAPRRILWGTGELTGDSWVFTFVGPNEANVNPRKNVGDLNAVTFTDDRFSTDRRAPEGPAITRAPRRNGQPLAPEGTRSPPVTLDDGTALAFGMPLAEAEARLGPSREGNQALLARAGIDREIHTPAAKLEFDRGRLRNITFLGAHRFVHPVRVFDEPWKNPDPIDDVAITRGMTRAAAAAYIERWKARAVAAGKVEGVDFRVANTNEQGWGMISVSLAPDRLTLNGRGIWSDAWSVLFAGTAQGGAMTQLSVLLDAYNSRARPPAGGPDPTLTGVTLPDGTELYFGQPLAEVEQLTGAASTTGSTLPGSTSPITGASPRRLVALRDYGLVFDQGLLSQIAYRRLDAAPAPFRQLWKNFTPVDGLEVKLGMTKEAFMAYLAAWEKRANAGRLQRDRDFHVRDVNTERSTSITVNMAPMRRSQTGAWAWDTWVVSFTGRETPRLVSLTARAGEFSAQPPSPAAQRKRDVKELTKDLPAVELPKFEVSLPPMKEPKEER
jgi:hypothetical protein